jgi:hypothetical protein
MPGREESSALRALSARGARSAGDLVHAAASWRALRLPDDPGAAADLITWSEAHGIFASMMKCRPHPRSHNGGSEIASDGVSRFWARIAGFVASAVPEHRWA